MPQMQTDSSSHAVELTEADIEDKSGIFWLLRRFQDGDALVLVRKLYAFRQILPGRSARLKSLN